MSDPKKPGQAPEPAASNDGPARIRNPGPNPRQYWTEALANPLADPPQPRDGLFAPGECRDITAEQAAAVRLAVSKGHLSTVASRHPKTGLPVPASVEFTNAPIKTAAQLLAEEEARLSA